ncbi:MAG: acyltransferase [Lysobacter sp.]|nr:acyltransferase [Lysobacter sp.]
MFSTKIANSSPKAHDLSRLIATLTTHVAEARRGDNFLPLRHLAALMVIYGHSYALTRHAPGEADFIAKLMPGFYAGNLAVYLVFAISGYLVTLSLLRQPGLWRYIRNRVLRVFPAYVVCLLVCIFVVGIAFTSSSTTDYLANPLAWRFFADNLIPISLQWTLRGVFETNPYPNIVNGTLWSLGLEIRWYVYLGLLAALTVIRRRWIFTALAMAWIVYCSWQWWHGIADTNEHRALGLTFLIAALCAHWRDYIPLSHWLMAAFAVVAVLAHGARWFGPSLVLAALYFTFWVAYKLPALRWLRSVDYSYGLFLYGFPVQQSLAALFPDIVPLAMLPSSAAIALLLAMLSWHLVEQPALRFKGYRGDTDPLPAV